MRILGIVGSPRRDEGLSYRIVSEILAGAAGACADVELLCLVDEEPEYCIHCGYPCFDRGDCAQEAYAGKRSQQIDEADAIVLAAPVYLWQPNGLTAAFLDKVRLSTGAWNRGLQHGKPALGIAVAGGTGSGVFTALQSLYAWFCLWKFRSLASEPVSRFNLDDVLNRAAARGQGLARWDSQPFADTWDVMATYDRLLFMGYGRIDEFRWLAEKIIDGTGDRQDMEEARDRMKQLLRDGQAVAESGDLDQEAQKVIEAYRIGAAAW